MCHLFVVTGDAILQQFGNFLDEEGKDERLRGHNQETTRVDHILYDAMAKEI
jgi:hypothetical protein